MAKCTLCGKAPSFGHNVSHANNRTARVWQPNIQRVKTVRNGTGGHLHASPRARHGRPERPAPRGQPRLEVRKDALRLRIDPSVPHFPRRRIERELPRAEEEPA